MAGPSKLLINESPLQVLPSLAELIGLNEAIVLQQIHYWIREAEKAGRNYYDGWYWVYNSVRGWHEQLPFWSANTVQRIFATLESKGVLVSGNYNQTTFDRTKWYRIDHAKLDSLLEARSDESITPDCLNPLPQNGVIECTSLGQPIPEITRDNHRLPKEGHASEILEAIQSLPYWATDPADEVWLEAFLEEHPHLTVQVLTECRDYWDGRRAGSKGAWKHRLRNWCKKAKEIASEKARHTRSLPESYTPTRDYADL